MANISIKSKRAQIDKQFIFRIRTGIGLVTLVDNNDFSRGYRYPLYTESKLSELLGLPELTADIVATKNNILPDIFDENGMITSTGINTLDNIGIKLTKLSATGDILMCGGEIFTYTSVLITDKGTLVLIHPEVKNRNSFGKMADFNLLAWYLIFKTFGVDITISSDDRPLQNSALSFTKIIL